MRKIYELDSTETATILARTFAGFDGLAAKAEGSVLLVDYGVERDGEAIDSTVRFLKTIGRPDFHGSFTPEFAFRVGLCAGSFATNRLFLTALDHAKAQTASLLRRKDE